MSKQPQSPPPGDKPAPTAPPAPPGWRHWLWPLALLAAVLLFLALPRVGSPPVNLTYSAFLSDVHAGKVKTFTLDNSTGFTAPGHRHADRQQGLHHGGPAAVRRHPAGNHAAEQQRADRGGRAEQRTGHRAALLADPAAPVHLGVLAVPAAVPGRRGRWWPARRAAGRRPVPGQGVRRRAAGARKFADVAGYEGSQGGDRRGRRLPEATPAGTSGPARWPRAAC